jgi:L-ribulose-5-phosphate 3-epimerase
MKKSITLRAFPRYMDTQHRLQLALMAGYDGVEINLEPGEEYSLDSDEDQLNSLREQIESLNLKVSSVYNRQQWYYPISSQDKNIRQRGQEIIESLTKAASLLGADAILVVPGAVDNGIFVDPPEITSYDVAYQNALITLKNVVENVGEKYKVTLAIENVWNKFLLSPLEFAHFVDEVGSTWIGVYFDVGNVLRTGFPEHWIPLLGKRIKRVHVKDFRKSVDNIRGFVNLLEGDVNWPAVKEALQGINYDSWITAEVLPTYQYHSERLIYETSASMDAIFGIT